MRISLSILLLSSHPWKTLHQLSRCSADFDAVFNATRSLQRRQQWPQRDDPVLAVLDGDDWLFDEWSLHTVASYYFHTGCWVTHGSFVEFPSENYILWQRQLRLRDVDSATVRQGDWITSAFRTFKHSLYVRINHEDLRQGGTYLQYAADLALMFPVLEMAGHRVEWVREIVYVYNLNTPFQDYKQSVAEQHAAAAHLRSLPRYRRLPAARVVQRAPAVAAWFEGCSKVNSMHSEPSASSCVRPFDSAQLTVQASGIWVPEEAVLLMELFDTSGMLQGEHRVDEQQLSMQFGGGFPPGRYTVVVSLLQLGEVGSDNLLAEVTMLLTLK
jgi:hypothetical protein